MPVLLIQVGLLLYPSSMSSWSRLQLWLYSQEEHEQTIFVAMMFAWYLAGSFILLGLIYILFSILFSKLCVCECVTQTADVDSSQPVEYQLLYGEDSDSVSLDF